MPTNSFRPPNGNLHMKYQRPFTVVAGPDSARAAELIRQAREKEKRNRLMYEDEAMLDFVEQ